MKHITTALMLVLVLATSAFAVERVYTEPYTDEMVRNANFGVISVANSGGYTMNGLAATPSVFPKEQDYTFRAAAGTIEVSSSSANDDGGGTGALTIVVEGLDANYAPISETITMNGVVAMIDDTTSHSSKSFLRVNRAYVATKGTGGVNAGDIYIHSDHASVNRTTGVPATATAVHGVILAGEGQMRSSHYTVPAGYSGYVSGLFGSADVGTTSVTLFATEPTAGKRAAASVLLGTGVFERAVTLPVAQKEDLLLELSTGASKTVHFGYKLFLKRN